IREDAAAFGNVADAAARHLVGARRGKVTPAHRDVARALADMAEQAADQGRLAHAVAPQQADGAATLDAQVDTVQDVAAAIPGMDVARLEDDIAPGAHA